MKVRLRIKISVNDVTATDIHLWGATSLLNVSPALVDDPFGEFEVNSTQVDQFDFYTLKSSRNLDSLELVGSASLSDGTLITPIYTSAVQPDKNQFEGQSTMTVRFKGNTGVMTITGVNSPHRFFDKNGGILAMGLTTENFVVWNQGWASIPFAAGNNTDVDIVVTHDGSHYRLYNHGDYIGSVAKSDVVASGQGELVIGNNSRTSVQNFAGFIKELGYNYTVATPDEIKTQSNNSLNQSNFWIGTETNLEVDDSVFGLSSDVVELQRITNLEVNNSVFGLTSDVVELQRITNLEVNDSVFGLSSDVVELQRTTNLEVNDSVFGLTSTCCNCQYRNNFNS